MLSLPSNRSPIAIVGIGCRFPAGACSPAELWNVLYDGVDAIINVPSDRWDYRRFYDANKDKPGKMYTRQAGFLKENIYEFDPFFFGISPREAETLDPQQRLLLEVAYEAFEDAGIPLDSLSGSNTGVYIGGFCLDNKLKNMSAYNRELANIYSGINATMTILSNRLSYAFNFVGPSMSVDTACSSSLVATHLACSAIWNGECSMALSGGVNVMLRPEYFINMCKGKFLSPHCRCKTYDKDGAGYVRSEGAGIVLLKPLEKAMEDGDPVYAVILSTGVNQDGQTNGISMPNPVSQSALIESVYGQAGIEPSKIRYVEAHGTGTQAGDPIETRALDAVLSRGRVHGDKCLVGSIKSNLGHLEAAAGIAGLIKAALCIHHGKVPPNIHFKNPNPAIPLDTYCIEVPVTVRDLDTSNPLYVGVNSFGYGGTNAHALLSKPKITQSNSSQNAIITDNDNDGFFLLPVSAHDTNALKARAQSFADFIVPRENGSSVSLRDFRYTCAHRLKHHSNRLAITADSMAVLHERLCAFAEGKLPQGVISGQILPEQERSIVFVYTGMGPQWWAMGRELYTNNRAFADTIKECDDIFKRLSGWSLAREMFEVDEDASRIRETRIAQPANLMLQISLTAAWKSLGIVPDAILGHSVGEIAAAHCANVLTLEDAIRIVYHRSRIQQKIAGKGSMLAVGLSMEEATGLLMDFSGVSIAAINGPNAVTLSGDTSELKSISAMLEENSVFNKFLYVEVAYHSCQTDLLKDELLTHFDSVKPQNGIVPLYSTVTGGLIDGTEMTGDYWWRNVRQPVQLHKAVSALADNGRRIFIEVGPHPVLETSIKECFKDRNLRCTVMPSLHRNKKEVPTLFEALSTLFTLGCRLDWTSLTPKGTFVRLPRYPWQKSRFWIESEQSKEERLGRTGNPFLNNRLPVPELVFQVEMNEQFFPFIPDHVVGGEIIIPAAAYLEAALALNREMFHDIECTIENVEFSQFLAYYSDKNQHIQTAFNLKESRFSIHSFTSNDPERWTEHATGRILPFYHVDSEQAEERFDVSGKTTGAEMIDGTEFYAGLAQRGLNYGPYFRRVEKIWRKDSWAFARMTGCIPADTSHLLYPPVLDGAFQTCFAALNVGEDGTAPYVPVEIEKLRFRYVPEDTCFVEASVRRVDHQTIRADITIFAEDGRRCVEVIGLSCRRIDGNRAETHSYQLYEFAWKEEQRNIRSKPVSPEKIWAFLANSDTHATKIMAAYKELGITAISLKDETKPPQTILDAHSIGRMLEASGATTLNGFLYAPSSAETNSSVYNSSVEHCTTLVEIVKVILNRQPESPCNLTIVTASSQQVVTGDTLIDLSFGPLWGVTHVVENEHPAIRCKCIDIPSWDSTKHIVMAIEEATTGNGDDSVAFRGESRYVKRIASISATEHGLPRVRIQRNTPVVLEVSTPGSFDNLIFWPAERRPPQKGEIEVEAHYCSVNYKDILKALGKISMKALEKTYFGNTLGMEAAGKVVALGEGVTEFSVGDEVVVANAGFSSYSTVPSFYGACKPKNLAFHEAPIYLGFLTAYYGLVEVARLQKGEKILIHNATGGVGLAAVQVAQWIGAEILATAGSEEKRQLLRDKGIKCVMDSRTLAFSDIVKKYTDGYGVDVVINAIAGEALRKSFELLAPYGRFIEIGKRDITDNNGLPMLPFNRNLSFAAIDVDRLLKERPLEASRIMRQITELFNEGYFSAMPVTIFDTAHVADAFRLLAQSKHIGKVVVDMRALDTPIVMPQARDGGLRRDGTYLVTGGTSGFGLHIGRWLAQNGAGTVVLVSRRGESPETIAMIESLKISGANIITGAVDVTDATAIAAFCEKLRRNNPIRGIFHCAMVLDDANLMDMDRSRFEKVMAPKAGGVLNLHESTKDDPIDYFVMFSSIASLIGNAGQANYIAANAFLDSFASYRQQLGLAATTINLGVISDIGVAARNARLESVFKSSGIGSFTSEEALGAMETAIDHGRCAVGTFDVDWARLMSVSQTRGKCGRYKDVTRSTGAGNEGVKATLAGKILDLPPEEQVFRIMEILTGIIAQVLRLEAKKIEPDRAISSLGIDSLTATELLVLIQEKTGYRFTTMQLLKGPSIADMAGIILAHIEKENA